MELPLAAAGGSPAHVPADFYYRIPVLPVYRSYPVYLPGKEPPGYFESLKQKAAEVALHSERPKRDQDWVRLGELVYDSSISFGGPGTFRLEDVRDPQWYARAGIPAAKDGTVPFFRYVVREKGKVELGSFSCGMCHTRVMPDGAVLKGGQGNFPFDRAGLALGPRPAQAHRMLFAAPFLKRDPNARLDRLSPDEARRLYAAMPPGVIARHGTSPFYPVHVPDLFDLKDRRYLDSTGLVRHRSIGDLMRYGALNQGLDLLSSYGGFRPLEALIGKLPPPEAMSPRYSDEQLYALARYLYTLKPPKNPDRPGPLVRRGQRVFEREGCGSCHAPPLYTNNKLTPAVGFTVPPAHRKQDAIHATSVGTDPALALQSRRGTGYYKVPSLRGVWARSMLGHGGWCATLEDWFDAKRLQPTYVPTGFKPPGAETWAVKGHPFGLALPSEDRKALIAFLRSL